MVDLIFHTNKIVNKFPMVIIISELLNILHSLTSLCLNIPVFNFYIYTYYKVLFLLTVLFLFELDH